MDDTNRARFTKAMNARPAANRRFTSAQLPMGLAGGRRKSPEKRPEKKSKKPMRVLVTGGAGYIGSVVAEEMLQAGHQVIVFDNLSRGHRQAVPKSAELVVGDLADRDGLDP